MDVRALKKSIWLILIHLLKRNAGAALCLGGQPWVQDRLEF